jgi:hypothetical protein
MPGGQRVGNATVTLSTSATNGCYGVLVEPRADQAGTYTVIRDGSRTEAERARLFIAGGR